MIIKLKNKINNFIIKFRSAETLKARVARGSVWLGIGSGIEQLLRLIRNIILVRILVPEAFGTMAIILAVIVFFEAFTEIGIREAIIQNPRGDKVVYLNGAWCFASIRAILLFTIANFSAPFISDFYNNPELTSLLRFSFLCILFKGFMSPGAYVVLKKMDFKKWVMIEHLGGIIGVLTAIILSFQYKNVWSLVIGFVVEGFSRFILSYIICPFVPKISFNRDDIRSLLKFASGMFGLPILTIIFRRIDVFVLGKMCSTEELGLYSMVLALANVPSLLFSKLISPVLTPAFSEMQADYRRINKSILKINAITAFIGIPIIVFVFLYSKSILTIFYTPQYALAAIPFGILFIVQMLVNFNVPIVSIYLALGRPELHRLFSLLRAVLVIILIYPAIKLFGLIGAPLALLAAMMIAYAFQIIKLKMLTDLNIAKYIIIFLKSFYISIPILIMFFIFKSFFSFGQVMNLLMGSMVLLFTFYLSYINIFKKSSQE